MESCSEMDTQIESDRKKEKKKNLVKLCFLLFLVSLLVEIFFFNIRSFDTMRYAEKELDASYNLTLIGGSFDSNGDLIMNDDADFVTLDISGFDYPLNNIRLDVECVDDVVSAEVEDHVCAVECYTFDEALLELTDAEGDSVITSGTLITTEGRILHDVEESHYLYLAPFGKTNELRVVMYPVSGMTNRLRIHDITFNARRPLMINPVRVAAIFIMLNVVYFGLISPLFWKEDCICIKGGKLVIAGAFLVGFSIFAVFIMLSNGVFLANDFSPYADLSRAICRGRLFVGEANDYVSETEGMNVFWRVDSPEVLFDYALHDGKYYVYFGLLPCLIFYLPYHLLTGGDMPNVIPSIVLRILTVALIGGVLHRIIQKYYKKTPFAMFILMWGAVTCGIYMPIFLTNMVPFYDIPIFSGLVLTLAGVFFWLALDKGKKGVNFINAVLGSVCMAAVSLCRPDMLIYGLAILGMIAWNHRTMLKHAEKKFLVKYFAAFSVPYVFFAAVCMIYNMLRFGSPLDFGASYNATTYPLGASLFLPYVIYRAVYEYLLKPPFLGYGMPATNYTVWEKVRQAGNIMVVGVFDGGLLIINPYAWALFLIGFYRKKLTEKKLLAPLVVLPLSGLFLMVYSVAYTSSIYTRYTLEFAPVILIAACIMLMEIYEGVSPVEERRLFHVVRGGIAVLLMVSVFWGIMQIGCSSNGDMSLSYGNTELWYRLYYACRVTR